MNWVDLTSELDDAAVRDDAFFAKLLQRDGAAAEALFGFMFTTASHAGTSWYAVVTRRTRIPSFAKYLNLRLSGYVSAGTGSARISAASIAGSASTFTAVGPSSQQVTLKSGDLTTLRGTSVPVYVEVKNSGGGYTTYVETDIASTVRIVGAYWSVD